MEQLKQDFWRSRPAFFTWQLNGVAANSTVLLLAACGGTNGSSLSSTGFPDSYIAPKATHSLPTVSDPNYEVLKIQYVDPYWITALEMDQREIQVEPMLDKFERVVEYTFPDIQPAYDHLEVAGWQPASEEMRAVTREILAKFGEILDISFVEGSEPAATNVISVGRSNQATTSGFS